MEEENYICDIGRKNIDRKIYSVTDLNLYVKSLLVRDDVLQDIWVKGEISNFTHHREKHMYFSLKDEKSEVQCVMFESKNTDLEFTPEEGMEVLCRGNVSLYSPRGKYQLVVLEMFLGGIGKLYLAYEELKEELKEEGLFDEEHKKPLPFLPKKVGIVTSEDGAALSDMISVLKRRFDNVDILVAPTPVQGEEAAGKIAEAIELIDGYDIDVMIVGRGGGSIEDLWPFNEEVVARAIFDSKTPVISAVGHETDFLISDFVADIRAPTPSAAAEEAVPGKQELVKSIRDERRRLHNSLKNLVQDFKKRLERVMSGPIFKRPYLLLEEPLQRLDENAARLSRVMKRNLREYKLRLKNQKERLDALGPMGIMRRGFSIAMDEEGEVLSSVDEIKENEIIYIKMIDGEIKALTKEVKDEER